MSTLSIALDRVVQAEQARFTEEFAKLERQLNEVRREHAKAVVALRQAERQVVREKEKSAEQLSFQQKELERKLEKCQLQLRSSEKERNMLMATVRQEGLKFPRSRPKQFTSSSGWDFIIEGNWKGDLPYPTDCQQLVRGALLPNYPNKQHFSIVYTTIHNKRDVRKCSELKVWILQEKKNKINIEWGNTFV